MHSITDSVIVYPKYLLQASVLSKRTWSPIGMFQKDTMSIRPPCVEKPSYAILQRWPPTHVPHPCLLCNDLIQHNQLLRICRVCHYYAHYGCVLATYLKYPPHTPWNCPSCTTPEGFQRIEDRCQYCHELINLTRMVVYCTRCGGCWHGTPECDPSTTKWCPFCYWVLVYTCLTIDHS